MNNEQNLFDMIKNNKWNEFVKQLDKNENIDVNIRDTNNNYFITYATLMNKSDVVLKLLNKKSKTDMIDEDGRCILYIVIKYNYKDLLKIFIENDTIGIPLTKIKDKNGRIPLHYAIIANNEEMTKYLIPHSDINAYDKKRYNSLHLAVRYSSYSICKILIENDIDIDSTNIVGESSLHIACNRNDEKLVELLINNNISLDIQDKEYESTALMYAVGNNNKHSVELLRSADPNIQDFNGNTALHYCILENRGAVFDSLINFKNIDFNLYNIDGRYPLHIVLLENTNPDIYIEPMLLKTNLNFQDKDGNTCFHLLSKRGYWKKYTNILSKCKIDIFIKNYEDIRPIDYIKEKDMKGYINLVTNSYRYILKTKHKQWQHDWEIMCKEDKFLSTMSKEDVNKFKDIVKNKNDEVCHSIIENKIYNMIKNNENNPSYPIKKERECLKIEKGDEKVKYCTFVGVTLDVIIGLIWLLKNHPEACSTLTSNFMENKDLCKYYRSLGLSIGHKCEFMNFEIIWVNNKIYLSENFSENFLTCMSDDTKRFMIVPIGIELKQGSHANYLIYDKKLKEVERFEPHGAHTPFGYDYNPSMLDNILKVRFNSIDPNITYIPPKKYLPKIGFQIFEACENRFKNIGDPSGFCALWVIWYVDMRMKHPDIPRDKLIRKIMKTIKKLNISFKTMIRNYSKEIVNMRDIVLQKAKLDINDWKNDNYTKEQLDIITKEITTMINPLIYM